MNMKLKLSRMNHRFKFLMAIAATIMLVGCNNELFVPPTVPVSGTIKLDGNPLAGAHILLVPMDTKNGRGRGDHISFAITGPSGEYSLKTRNGQAGAARGMHLVLISKQKPKIALVEKPSFDNPDTPPVPKPATTRVVNADAIDLMQQISFPWLAAGRDEKPEIVPVQYNRESTLSATIGKGGTKTLDFDLTGIKKLP